MKDFAAIDFETANGRRTSVCSVGVVVVRGGEVVDTLYSLIRPRPNFYSRFTTAIHGLSYEDTAQAPDFADVWKQIAPRIEGLPLVAHNSPFDEGCLAQDVRQQPAQPPAPYRVGGVRFRPCQPPPCPGRCRGVRADRAENPVTGFLSRNRNSRQ